MNVMHLALVPSTFAMHKLVWRIGVVWLVLIATIACYAAETHVKNGHVYLNNVPVLDWKSNQGNSKPEDHSKSIAKKLSLANEDDLVSVNVTGLDASVKVGSSIEVRIPKDEAVLHHATPKALASAWASAIRDALSLPALKFPDDAVRLPVGISKVFRLTGSSAYGASLVSSDDQVVRVTRSDDLYVLQCLSSGDVIVRAESGMASRNLRVSVRPVAASFPQSITIDVSGNPATSSYIQSVVEGALKTRLSRLYGAEVRTGPFKVDALGKGRSQSISVLVRARAIDAFDGTGRVDVLIRNTQPKAGPISKLWYSNAPESVKQVGNLFAGILKPNEPVRFLYHHTIAASQPLVFRAEIINESDRDTRVQIVEADSKPDKNPVVAGLRAARQYFKNHQFDNAEWVNIPAHSAIPLSFHRLLPQDTISGISELVTENGSPELLVRADILPPIELNTAWYNANFNSAPWRETGFHTIDDYDKSSYERSDHVYPNPFKEEEIGYEVGGRFGVLLIGLKPIAGEDHANNLDGNYGVLHLIHVNLKNPSERAADASMTFESSSGYTTGVFGASSGTLEIPFLGPKGVGRLLVVHLKPGESKQFDLTTMPINGGAYPITLTIRPSATSR